MKNVTFAHITYCKAYFTVTITTDDDGNESTVYTEIEESDVVIPATGHDYDYDNGTWTWTEIDDGYTATYTVVCKNDSSHILVLEATVTFVELDDGTIEYTASVYSSDNGETYTDTLEVEGEVVQTSDSSNIAMMSIILFMAIMGCAGAAVCKRR